MRCFSTYLKEYRKGGIAKSAEYQLALPVEIPVIPECVKNNVDATNFFAGMSVYNEKIETWSKQYFYEALFVASNECKEEELSSFIKKGLKELGCPKAEISVKRVLEGMKKRDRQDFKITIKTL